jgi:hypothetical protein
VALLNREHITDGIPCWCDSIKELAKPEQEPTACGYDETVGMCTNNPCCEQEPVSHLWECIGRWSAYLASNREKANLAPPTWLVDAVKAATARPTRPWVGLTDEEILDLWVANHKDTGATDAFAHAIEARLKELNT